MNNCDNKEELKLIQSFKMNRKETLENLLDYLKNQEYNHSIRYSEKLLDEIFFDKKDQFIGPRILKEDIVALLQDPSVKNDYLNAIKKLDFENFNEYQLVMSDEILDMLRVVTTENRKFRMNFIYGHDLNKYIDLSHKDFKKIIFEDEVFFPKCQLNHSSFRGSKGAILDINKMPYDMSHIDFCDATFASSNYREAIIIKKKIVHHSNFEGCVGLDFICLQTIPNRDCSYVNFGKTFLAGRDLFLYDYDKENALNGCIIHHSNFSNCIYYNENFKELGSAKLDPHTVPDRDCSYVNFGTVRFVNTLDECKIIYSIFANSIDAEFNPQTIPNKDLSGVKLADVTLTGPLDGCILNDTDFEGIKSLCTVDINKVTYNENTNFTGADVVGYDPSIHPFNPTIGVTKNKEKVLSLFDKAKI